ncbi:MAG: hypothetical protein ACREIT_07145 [Tepidisphaeraceae bacterium]
MRHFLACVLILMMSASLAGADDGDGADGAAPDEPIFGKRAAKADDDKGAPDRDGGEPTHQDSPAVLPVRAAFDAGDFRQSLKLANEALAKRRPKANDKEAADDLALANEVFELNRLRAESQIRLNDLSGAKASFEQAVKVAPDEESFVRARARAMVALLSRAKGDTYFPKQVKKDDPAAAGFKVIEPESRGRALGALWTDLSVELTRKTAKVDKVTPAKLVELLPAFGELRAVEIASPRGDSKQSQALYGPMLEDGLNGLAEQVEVAESEIKRLDGLAHSASIELSGRRGKVTDTNLRGLIGRERKEAGAVGTAAVKLGKTALKGAQTAHEWDLPEDPWLEITQRCDTVVRNADALLKIIPGQDFDMDE